MGSTCAICGRQAAFLRQSSVRRQRQGLLQHTPAHDGRLLLSTIWCLLTAGMISSNLDLHRYATGRESRVVTALTLLKSHLFQYQGHVSAALVLGGVDFSGPHLFTVSLMMVPTGSAHVVPAVCCKWLPPMRCLLLLSPQAPKGRPCLFPVNTSPLRPASLAPPPSGLPVVSLLARAGSCHWPQASALSAPSCAAM